MAIDAHESPSVDISLCSRFHAFDLARELSTLGMLHHLHTGYPAFLAPRWGVPRNAVRSVWTGELVNRALATLYRHKWLTASPDPFVCERHDRIVASRLRPGADIVIGWSSQCRATIAAAKRLGMLAIVERGSTHIQWQYQELMTEAGLTGLEVEVPHPRTIERELAEYESADYIAVPSTFVAGTFIAAGLPHARLLINPYGVDLSLFSDGGRPSPFPARERGLRVLHVGGVAPRKGVHYLLEAVARVPEATLTLVGGISPGMATHVRRYGRVRAIGGVPGRHLPRWYREADVFCLLSIEEGLALVLLQAMAMGLPVIATPNTGAEDLIEDGVHGFIVPIRDSEAVARRLQQLADAPELRWQMGSRARARVAEGFGWSGYGKRARAIYETLIR